MVHPKHGQHLDWDLERHGFAGRELTVRDVVRSARVAGLSPVLIAVLAEPAEPEAARLRALGKLAAALSSRRHVRSGSVDSAA